MNAITEILCRYDTTQNIGVVFIPCGMDDNNITAWTGGQETQLTTVHYYKDTKPLSSADEEVLRKNYAEAMNDPNVRVRHRLPRTEKFRANLLAQPSALPSPVTNQASTEAPQSTQPTVSPPTPKKRGRKKVAKLADDTLIASPEVPSGLLDTLEVMRKMKDQINAQFAELEAALATV